MNPVGRSLRTYWQNTKGLPFPLRSLIQGAMVAAPLLLLFLAAPGTEWEIDGRFVSYAELWSSGDGAAIATFLTLGGGGAWGLAARSSVSRWLLVISPVAPYVVLAIFPASSANQISFFVVVSAILTAAVFYVGLFRIAAVSDYLAAHGGR